MMYREYKKLNLLCHCSPFRYTPEELKMKGNTSMWEQPLCTIELVFKVGGHLVKTLKRPSEIFSRALLGANTEDDPDLHYVEFSLTFCETFSLD